MGCDDADVPVRELGRTLGGHHDVRAVRQHDHLLGRQRVDRGQQVVGRGVERRAAVENRHPERGEQGAHPVAGGDGHRAADRIRIGLRQPRVALLDLLAHVGDIEVRDRSGAGEHRGGGVRIIGVDVDLERARVADDEHRVADRLERQDEAGRPPARCR